MPAAPTNTLAIYTAIANALDNSTLDTLVEMKQHRLRFDDPALIAPGVSIESLWENASDADFPRWIMWPTEPGDSAFMAAPGFLDRASGFNPKTSPWLSVNAETFKLSIVHRDQRLASICQNEEDVLAAIRTLGPTLGFSYVKSWGKVTGKRYFAVTALTGGSERCQTDMTIPVTLFLNGPATMP